LEPVVRRSSPGPHHLQPAQPRRAGIRPSFAFDRIPQDTVEQILIGAIYITEIQSRGLTRPSRPRGILLSQINIRLDRDILNGVFESASTMRPSARSLSATKARGVGRPTVAPSVWSLGNRTISSAGIDPSLEYCWSSEIHTSART